MDYLDQGQATNQDLIMSENRIPEEGTGSFRQEANKYKMEMFAQVNNRKNDIEKATRRISDINRLMKTFTVNVYHQDQVMEGGTLFFFELIVVGLAQESVDTMKKANKELVIANDYNKSAGTWWSWLFIFMGVFVLFWDLWKYK